MASCCSTAFAAEDLQSVMHRLGRQIQHHAGPMYDRHRHSVLSMIKCHFTSPHSPSHTAPYLCFHPSRGRPILVCFGPACLQLPLFAASNAQEGCGRTTGVCVLFRPPPSFHPHHVMQRATVVVSREGPPAPRPHRTVRAILPSHPTVQSLSSPPSIPGGVGHGTVLVSHERSLDFGERRNIRARGSLFSGFGELGFPLFQFWGK